MIPNTIDEACEDLLLAAVYVAERVGGRDEKTEALEFIIALFLERGDMDTAADLADSIEDPFVRDRQLTRIVAKCAELKDDEYAFQLVDAIDEHSARNTARESIAFALANRTEIAKAKEIAGSLEHPAEAISAISISQAFSGKIENSLNTAREIEFPVVRIRTLREVARIFYKNGLKDEALKALEEAASLADELDFDEEKIFALCEIGTIYAEIGESGKSIAIYAQARDFANNVQNASRDSHLVSVAIGFLHAGSIDLADRTLDLVKDKNEIANCLLGFARIFRTEEDEEEAREALNEALLVLESQPASEVRDTAARLRTHQMIAQEFANFGDIARALDIADTIPDMEARDAIWTHCGVVAAKNSEPDSMQEVLTLFEEETAEVRTRVNIAEVFAGSGRPEEAKAEFNKVLQVIDGIDQPLFCAEILPEIIVRVNILDGSENVRFYGAKTIELVGEIKGLGARARVLGKLASAYQRSGYTLNESEKVDLKTVLRTSDW
ncbi:MAG: tetratricopeptide repeat protein [Pyrinomonadaceae bacterium]